jgi:thioredoxin 1
MLKSVLAVLLLTASSAAVALDKQPFDEARFAALQATGEVVLVDVYAPWCKTCQKQQELIARWTNENPERKLTVLEVDFDDDKASVTRFKAPRQSTLVLFKGGQQQWFSVAETRYEMLAAALDQAYAGGD